MTGLLRPLDRDDLRSVTALLDRHPARDVYLRSLVWKVGVTLPAPSGQLLGWFVDDEPRGVFLHSPVVVLACEDDDGTVAFADWVAGCEQLVPLSQVVAPRPMVEAFLARLDQRGATPPLRLLRERLLALKLDRASLAVADGLPGATFAVPAPVRPAQQGELGLAGHAALAVTREELGFGLSPHEEEAFTSALERRIRAGREYLWIEGRRLLFRAAISAATPEAVLVEGVWVPPEERGGHRGTWAMHALASRLLRWHRTIALFVGADNERARRVYGRVGFAPFEEFAVAYFETV